MSYIIQCIILHNRPKLCIIPYCQVGTRRLAYLILAMESYSRSLPLLSKQKYEVNNLIENNLHFHIKCIISTKLRKF